MDTRQTHLPQRSHAWKHEEAHHVEDMGFPCFAKCFFETTGALIGLCPASTREVTPLSCSMEAVLPMFCARRSKFLRPLLHQYSTNSWEMLCWMESVI